LEYLEWNQQRAEIIINKMMLANDAFSKWLGINIEEISEDNIRLSLVITPEMSNGFGIAHGGIVYSLSDSALAFASNAYGRQALSIESSISHLKPLKIGEKVYVNSIKLHIGRTLGHFEVLSYNQIDQLVGIFKGTVFYNGQNW